VKPSFSTLAACGCFAGAVLLFTRMDYLVNKQLYDHGLQFSEDWYSDYSLYYSLLYQLVIALVFLQTRSWKLCFVLEAFVLSSAQDFVYFGLWEGGKFPQGDWTWMQGYKTLGHWTTQDQTLLSVGALVAALVFAKVTP
jgi:hypothetical protein